MDRWFTRRRTLAAATGLAGGAVLGGCSAPRAGPEWSPDGFTLAVLPDTQHYARLDNGLFEAQARWIVRHRDELGIDAVCHLGDLVHDPTDGGQWAVATDAVARLDEAGVPALLALGNHDATEIRSPRRFRSRFPAERYERLVQRVAAVTSCDTFDGNPENAFLRLDTDCGPVLLLTIEFGPRAAVVDWADDVLAANADATALLTTHSYLYSDDTRVDRSDDHNPRSYGLTDVHNGAELWAALVRHHDNLRVVHGGHHITGAVGSRIDERGEAPPVFQLFANYQTRPRGGNGWLALVTLDGNNIRARHHSPVLSEWRRIATASL